MLPKKMITKLTMDILKRLESETLIRWINGDVPTVNTPWDEHEDEYLWLEPHIDGHCLSWQYFFSKSKEIRDLIVDTDTFIAEAKRCFPKEDI